MIIGPVGSDLPSPYPFASAAEPVDVPLQGPDPSPQEPATGPAEPPVEESAVEVQVEQEGVPGVLRLLLAGHFKGVADVRLRIVFHDELAALQAEATRTAAAEAAGALTEAVGVLLDEFTSSGAPGGEQVAEVDELQQAFEQAAGEVVEQFNTAPDVDEGALTNGLNSAFDGLVGSLETLLAPPEEPAETPSGPVVEEPAVEPSVPDALKEAFDAVEQLKPALLETLPAPAAPQEPAETLSEPVTEEPAVEPSVLDALKDAFDAGMVRINEALATSLILSPPSPSRGNGVAYEKFLAVYEQLNAPAAEPVDDTQDQVEDIVGSVDAEA